MLFMYYVYLLGVIPSLVYGQNLFLKPSYQKVCGSRTVYHHVRAKRIIGGEVSRPHSWPWMVALYRFGEHKCGAALISEKHVITAAHCVDKLTYDSNGKLVILREVYDASVFEVRLGVHNQYFYDIGTKPTKHRVKKVVRHEQFVPKTLYYDIAILTLTKNVKFTNAIRPICLPDKHMEVVNKTAYVTGWGTVKADGTNISPVLKELKIPIWNQRDCKKAYRAFINVTDIQMCGGYDDGSTDTCEGDSGGPVQMQGEDDRFYLIGIVSGGTSCAKPNFPGVYTQVTTFLSWIGRNIEHRLPFMK